MLAAAFTLIQCRMKTPSPRDGVREEVEGEKGRVPVWKIVHQDHVVLRNGSPAASDFI